MADELISTAEAARRLGVARVEFLGYVDSGMLGTPTNDHPESFWRADVEEAARRLATILEEEGTDVVTVYDANGTYGHPDHVQVHHVGLRAADLAGTPAVYQVTLNRDRFLRLLEKAEELGLGPKGEDRPSEEVLATVGLPESEITTVVDVATYVPAKLAAMRCHETQVGDMGPLLTMPVEAFTEAFGQEFYVRVRAPEGTPADHLV